MKNWMKKLIMHHNNMRSLYPDDRLLILFDIDGTIVDMRSMILYVLKSFDEQYETFFFKGLKINDIQVHESNIDQLLAQLHLPKDIREKVMNWCTRYLWSSENIMSSHRPFFGVMAAISWFQKQPNTFVGLNSGRSESLRKETYRSIGALGKAHNVNFQEDLLYMNANGCEHDVCASKAQGIYYFKNKGYRIFAVVDNEHENLTAIAQIDKDREILLLDANTIFDSNPEYHPLLETNEEKNTILRLLPATLQPHHI